MEETRKRRCTMRGGGGAVGENTEPELAVRRIRLENDDYKEGEKHDTRSSSAVLHRFDCRESGDVRTSGRERSRALRISAVRLTLPRWTKRMGMDTVTRSVYETLTISIEHFYRRTISNFFTLNQIYPHAKPIPLAPLRVISRRVAPTPKDHAVHVTPEALPQLRVELPLPLPFRYHHVE